MKLDASDAEEHGGFRDVTRSAEATERDQPDGRLRARVVVAGSAGEEARQHRRVGGAGADRVGANAVRREIERDRARVVDQSALDERVHGR